jgi:hypothetical protein
MMKRITTAAVLLFVFVATPFFWHQDYVRAQQCQRQVMDAAAEMQRIVTPQVTPIPWFDLGAVNDENLKLLVKGLQAWDPIADGAVVTIGARHVGNHFRWLQEMVPSMQLIPSITTSGIMGHCEHWGSQEKWLELAAVVMAVHEQLPDVPVLLENEWALRDFFQGKKPLDYTRFAMLLNTLPRDVDYIWYPSAGGWGDKLERYITVSGIVQAMIRPVHFADHVSLYSYPDAYRTKTYHAAAKLEEVARVTVPMIYTQKWGDNWENVPDALW